MKHHFIASLALSLALFPLFGYTSFLVMVSGFLIDADHYLWYILKYNDFSLIKAVQKTKDKSVKYKIHIFHLYEFFGLCVVLAFFYDAFIAMSAGLAVHYIMDMIYMGTHGYGPEQRVNSIFQLFSRDVRKCALQ